jgi:hypothetical protein
MSIRGRVKDGAIVLDSPIPLPDGTPVRVEPELPAKLAGLKRYGEDRRTPQERLAEIMAEQGVEKTATYENLVGAGADLWDSDEEFEAFMATIAATRAEKG